MLALLFRSHRGSPSSSIGFPSLLWRGPSGSSCGWGNGDKCMTTQLLRQCQTSLFIYLNAWISVALLEHCFASMLVGKHTTCPAGIQMQVGPGDVLYLPACWFHRVSHRCSGHDYVMALNYWWVLCALRECACLNLRGNKVFVAEGRVCYFPAHSTALMQCSQASSNNALTYLIAQRISRF